jgi:putative thioredoxin
MEETIDDKSFKQLVLEKSSETPVVVDFWAEWCMPCLMLGPVLGKLAEEYKGRFILAKANVDDARKAAQAYFVMSIPNVKMFKNGKVVDEFVGALPESQVKKWLDKNI